MFNKKSPNTPLLLLNCASKNSLKNLFKLNAQAKINLNKGILAYHPIRKGRIIVVLPSAKLILNVDGGKCTYQKQSIHHKERNWLRISG